MKGLGDRRELWLMLLIAGASACGDPPVVSPPYLCEVLSYAGEGRYQLRAEPLATLTDFARLNGEAARFKGGGSIRPSLDADSPTEDQLRRAFRVRQDEDVRLDYRISGGVVRAYDYDTFALLSLYRSLERTRTFYQAAGVLPDGLPTLTAYFRPRIESLLLPYLVSDNAAYSPLNDGFLFFNDFLDGNDVPLALNLGVVAHEYGHAIFHALVWQKKLAPWLTETWPAEPVNHLRALDEGLADVFGAIITRDPAFIGRSVAVLSAQRDLAVTRILTEGQLRAALDSTAVYDPYRMGSVIASALWASAAGDHDALARDVVAAETRLSGTVTVSFRAGTFLNALLAVTPASRRKPLCDVYNERLSVLGPFPCCTEACP